MLHYQEWNIERGRFSQGLRREEKKEAPMLYWTVVFLIIALVAGLFGFTGIYAAAAGIAKILFFIFLVLFVIGLLTGGFRRPRVL
jgi:uncharacterized membrane protein YtjA (UPF0391 family)